MTRCVPLLLLVAALAAGPAAGQSPTPHPADAEVARLIAADPSTMGMRRAYAKGLALWERDVDRSYARLLAALDDEGRAALRASQRDWRRYRERERALIAAVYGRKDGTIYGPMALEAAMAVVRARALVLREHLEAALDGRPQ